MNSIVLFSLAANVAQGVGDSESKPAALGLGLGIILLLLASWLLSFFIAYLIARAGVRAGVQVLVDQGRAARELLQAQTALLNQLVKRDTASAPTSTSSSADASAWDKLRNQ